MPSSGLCLRGSRAAEIGCGARGSPSGRCRLGLALTHRPCSSSPRGSAPTGSVSCPRRPGRCTGAEHSPCAAVPELQLRHCSAAPPPPLSPRGPPRPLWPCRLRTAGGTDGQRREDYRTRALDPCLCASSLRAQEPASEGRDLGGVGGGAWRRGRGLYGGGVGAGLGAAGWVGPEAETGAGPWGNGVGGALGAWARLPVCCGHFLTPRGVGVAGQWHLRPHGLG